MTANASYLRRPPQCVCGGGVGVHVGVCQGTEVRGQPPVPSSGAIHLIHGDRISLRDAETC